MTRFMTRQEQELYEKAFETLQRRVESDGMYRDASRMRFMLEIACGKMSMSMSDVLSSGGNFLTFRRELRRCRSGVGYEVVEFSLDDASMSTSQMCILSQGTPVEMSREQALDALVKHARNNDVFFTGVAHPLVKKSESLEMLAIENDLRVER